MSKQTEKSEENYQILDCQKYAQLVNVNCVVSSLNVHCILELENSFVSHQITPMVWPSFFTYNRSYLALKDKLVHLSLEFVWNYLKAKSELCTLSQSLCFLNLKLLNKLWKFCINIFRFLIILSNLWCSHYFITISQHSG